MPHRSCGCIAACILTLSTQWRWVSGQLHALAALLPGRNSSAHWTGRGGWCLRASLDILENRITLDPARNRAKDHPVHSLLTYRLSYPSSNRSYIINICVNAEHHNRLHEVSMGSICDTSICDDFRFFAVLLPYLCVLCSVVIGWL
jgi:hypothetical protein